MREADSDVLTYAGSLTLQDAATIKDDILALWKMDAEAALDLQHVAEAHFSIVQVIEAARISAEQQGKRLRLQTRPSAAFKTLTARSGLLEEPGSRDFWQFGA